MKTQNTSVSLRRFTAASLLAASTVLGSAAFADSSSRLCPSLPEGLYVGFNGGMNFASNLKTRDDFVGQVINPALTAFGSAASFTNTTNLDLRAKPGTSLGLHVGYRLPKSLYSFSDKVAFRVEAGLLNQSITYKAKDLTLQSAVAGDPTVYTLAVSNTSLSTLSVLGSVYADIHCTSDIDLTLGFGAGWSTSLMQGKMGLAGYNAPVGVGVRLLDFDTNDRSSKFLFSFMFGPSVKLGSDATVSLAYRFTWLSKPKFLHSVICREDGNPNYNQSNVVGLGVRSILSHSVQAGFSIQL
jgi:opacity protein-like surface antigen